MTQAASQTSSRVHPSASVSPESKIDPSVEIGPGCILDGEVTLCEGVRLLANVHIAGPVTIGKNTIVYPGACIGFPPQDYKFSPGDPTAGVVIGEDCILREHVTIHAASNNDTPTTVGNGVFMMVGSHLGHDVRVGNKVIIVNHSVVGGHAQIGDNVNISGLVAIHQHARVGRLAMVSGGVANSMDVPPFCMSSERNRISGVNLIGLRRSGMDRKDISAVRRAFRAAFYPSLTRTEQIEVLRPLAEESEPVREMLEFVESAKRSICGGPMRPPRSAPWVRAAIKGDVDLSVEADDE